MVFFLCCRNWSLLSFKKYICEVLGVVLKQLGAIKSIRSPRVYTVEDYYRDQKGTFSELLRPSVDLIHRQMSSSHFILWRQEHLKRFSREGTGNFVDKVKEDYCRNKYIVLGFVFFHVSGLNHFTRAVEGPYCYFDSSLPGHSCCKNPSFPHFLLWQPWSNLSSSLHTFVFLRHCTLFDDIIFLLSHLSSLCYWLIELENFVLIHGHLIFLFNLTFC